MPRWNRRYLRRRYGPKIKEYDLINETKEGKPYFELSYILMNDVPIKFHKRFERWVLENKAEIIVGVMLRKKKGQEVERIEKKAVNVMYWEKWYSTYGINIK